MRKLFLILSVFISQEMVAQSVIQGSTDDINAIKIQQDKYIFAESTDKSESVATENALTILADQIDAWVTNNPGRGFKPSAEKANVIVTKRGPYFRVFTYVDSEKDTVPQSLSVDNSNEGQAHSNTARKVAETEEVSSVGSLLEINRFDQMKKYIDTLESDGLLIDYGKYATLPESGDCFIVIYDRAGNIRAKLIRENKVLKNLETGKQDTPSGYPGCGALWFRTFNGRLK